LVAVLFFVLRNDKPAPAAANAQKSIAVLPFTDLSENKDQDYFTDGLSEELLNRLAQVRNLQVAARTSSFYYKGRNETMRAIGEQLGVDYILEGSVRKAGDSVRISAQLIKANDGFQVFSESYDRKLEDIFAVQGEIAQAVTTALSVSLSAGEFNRPGMTHSVQAYEAYLRRNNPEEDLLKSIDALKQAVAIDKDFGLAWNELYRAYEFSTIALPANVSADFNTAKQEALQRTGQLIPDSPEYLVSKAMAERRQTHWQQAEQLFLKVLTNSGNSDATANLNYGEFLWSVGRVTDALPYLQRAKRLDPKDVDVAARLGATLSSVGQSQEALAEAERGKALAPEDGFMNFVYFSSLLGLGEFGRAAELMQQRKFPKPNMQLVQALQVRNTDAKAVPAALNNLKASLDRRNLSPANNTAIGTLVAVAGDADSALSFFSAAANGNIRDIFGALMIWQPYMSDMRKLPGFKKLASDAGLADYWRSTGKWPDYCKPVPNTESDFECF
jgi:TolB-like protein/Flp pilus assembly protein TadD